MKNEYLFEVLSSGILSENIFYCKIPLEISEFFNIELNCNFRALCYSMFKEEISN
jgi:hypothetical protein